MFWWLVLIIAVWYIRRGNPTSGPAYEDGDADPGLFRPGYYQFADGVAEVIVVEPLVIHARYYHMDNGQLQRDLITAAPDGRVRFDPYRRRIGGRIAGFMQDYQIVQWLTDGHCDTILT